MLGFQIYSGLVQEKIQGTHVKQFFEREARQPDSILKCYKQILAIFINYRNAKTDHLFLEVTKKSELFHQIIIIILC